MDTVKLDSQKKKEYDLLKNKLDSEIQKRGKDIKATLAKIESDGTLLNDFVVPTNKLVFDNLTTGGEVLIRGVNDGVVERTLTIGDYASGQIADKFGIPRQYLGKIITGEEWQRDLAVETLNTYAQNIKRERVLVREVDGQVRGFLSDSYRRLNSMQIFSSFLMASMDTGSVLIDGCSGETRNFLEVIKPEIISIPTPKNGMVFRVYGAQIRSSDFGNGALELRTMNMVVRCMNGLVTKSVLREIHLGRKLPDDLKISEETYRKDTDAMASLVKDAMNSVFSKEFIEEDIMRIQMASGIEVNFDTEIRRLPKLNVLDSEVEEVKALLMQNNPDDGMEGEPTLWKFAQALSAVARNKEGERKRDLQEIAGTMIYTPKL